MKISWGWGKSSWTTNKVVSGKKMISMDCLSICVWWESPNSTTSLLRTSNLMTYTCSWQFTTRPLKRVTHNPAINSHSFWKEIFSGMTWWPGGMILSCPWRMMSPSMLQGKTKTLNLASNAFLKETKGLLLFLLRKMIFSSSLTRLLSSRSWEYSLHGPSTSIKCLNHKIIQSLSFLGEWQS